MKDKTMMMYDHIRSSVDVDPWAIEELKKVLDAYLADGCKDCRFEATDEWELPCRKCKRNAKDYWRAKDDESGSKMQIQSIPEKIWNQLSEPDREAMEMAFSALEAQETCDDTISRQSAINALNEYSNNETTSTEKAVGADFCVDIIQNLPSVQPEIIHCRDCKWWEKQEKTLQGKCYLLQQTYPTGAWYCGNAERKANESKH